MKADNKGRDYIHITQVGPGVMVEFDEGFGCLLPGTQYEVFDYGDDFAVRCNSGIHGLSVQVEPDGYLTGVYLSREAELMTEARFAIQLTPEDITLDAFGSHDQYSAFIVKRARLWLKLGLPQGLTSHEGLGNWFFGSIVQSAINEVKISFPYRYQKKLSWQAHTDRITGRIVIEAST